ncbi:hypothetical protein ARAM_003366, partial [Aspergillus rambellii]
MHFPKPLAVVLIQLTLGCRLYRVVNISYHANCILTIAVSPVAATGCGEYDACIGTEYCATKTFTTPVSTIITTCLPTATCLGVYEGCSFGGGMTCCSGYCAATRCRSTDTDWPSCSEDMGACIADENCCYGNQCVDGLCIRPPYSSTQTTTTSSPTS